MIYVYNTANQSIFATFRCYRCHQVRSENPKRCGFMSVQEQVHTYVNKILTFPYDTNILGHHNYSSYKH